MERLLRSERAHRGARKLAARAAQRRPLRGLINSTTSCAASADVVVHDLGSRTRPDGRQFDLRGLESALPARRGSRCRGRRVGARVRPRSAAAGTRACASGIARRTARAPCRSISSSTLLPAASASSIGRPRRAVAVGVVHGRPLEQLAAPRSCGRTRRRRRSSSARRRPRRGAAGASSPRRDSCTSGWCSRM